MNKFRWLLKRMKLWLQDHVIESCASCGRFIREKDAIYERAFTGQNLPLCKNCHEKWFAPLRSTNGNCQ